MKFLGIYKQKKSTTTPPPPGGALEALDVTIPDTLTVGQTVTGSYTYNSPNNSLEANEPPICEGVEISGVLEVGEILTANIIGFQSQNGQAQGVHTYRWYRASDQQQLNEVQFSTEAAPVIPPTAESKFIRVEVDLIQTGGGNTVGKTYYSTYTKTSVSLGPPPPQAFDPLTIPWAGAWRPFTLEGYTDAWNNEMNELPGNTATLFGDLTQDGTAALPTYDAAQQAMRFVKASSQRLLTVKPSTAIVSPWTAVIRFKLANIQSGISQYLIAANNSIYVGVNGDGKIFVSGPTGIIDVLNLVVPNQWYVITVTHDGLNTMVNVNYATNYGPLASGTQAFGTGNFRVGSTWSGTYHLDGWISHLFIKGGALTTTENDNMKLYFGL
jgi:hypothetical protein